MFNMFCPKVKVGADRLRSDRTRTSCGTTDQFEDLEARDDQLVAPGALTSMDRKRSLHTDGTGPAYPAPTRIPDRGRTPIPALYPLKHLLIINKVIVT